MSGVGAGVWFVVCGLLFLVCDFWFVVSSVWFLVPCVWCLVSGALFLVSSLVSCFLCLVSCVWCLASCVLFQVPTSLLFRAWRRGIGCRLPGLPPDMSIKKEEASGLRSLLLHHPYLPFGSGTAQLPSSHASPSLAAAGTAQAPSPQSPPAAAPA